jgi:uncharacterized protein
MRVVLDSNVLVSALIWQGLPRRVLDDGLNAGWEFYSSPQLLAELDRVLRYPRLVLAIEKKRQTHENLLGLLQDVLRVIQPQPLFAPICRDPDDDEVLACARAAHADFIVSGDQDLLVLEAFEGISILTAAQAVAQLI